VGPALAQLVTPATSKNASPKSISALRLFHPSDRRTNPQITGATGDPLRSPRMLAAAFPVEICTVTLPVAPDPTVGPAGVNTHVAFNGSVVQPSVNVPCEPPSVVNTSV
jgi:hypothetical protein